MKLALGGLVTKRILAMEVGLLSRSIPISRQTSVAARLLTRLSS